LLAFCCGVGVMQNTWDNNTHKSMGLVCLMYVSPSVNLSPNLQIPGL